MQFLVKNNKKEAERINKELEAAHKLRNKKNVQVMDRIDIEEQRVVRATYPNIEDYIHNQAYLETQEQLRKDKAAALTELGVKVKSGEMVKKPTL